MIKNRMERHLQKNDIDELKSRDGYNYSYIHCQFVIT